MEPILTPIDSEIIKAINQKEFHGFSMVNSDFGKLFQLAAEQNGPTESSSSSTLALQPSTSGETEPQQSAKNSTETSTNEVEPVDSSLSADFEGVTEEEAPDNKEQVAEESVKEENNALVDCGTQSSAVSSAAKGARKVPGNHIATHFMSTAL